jgi:hypothetical protein
MKIIKKFDDLRSGDRLFCVNMDTHEKVLCEVIRKIEYQEDSHIDKLIVRSISDTIHPIKEFDIILSKDNLIGANCKLSSFLHNNGLMIFTSRDERNKFVYSKLYKETPFGYLKENDTVYGINLSKLECIDFRISQKLGDRFIVEEINNEFSISIRNISFDDGDNVYDASRILIESGGCEYILFTTEDYRTNYILLLDI